MTSLSKGRRGRRSLLLGVLAAVASLSVAAPAEAGTYLNRAVMLLHGATREAAYLRARFSDKELARVTQRLAQARLDAANAMTVPKEVVLAHPHLLLVLENYTQAAEAATKGEVERFGNFHQRALDEERAFKAVLKQHGWVLPEAP
ncbi:MAG TPA: hypothetical protein VGK73_37340 [Polyangiaceae bacterium]